MFVFYFIFLAERDRGRGRGRVIRHFCRTQVFVGVGLKYVLQRRCFFLNSCLLFFLSFLSFGFVKFERFQTFLEHMYFLCILLWPYLYSLEDWLNKTVCKSFSSSAWNLYRHAKLCCWVLPWLYLIYYLHLHFILHFFELFVLVPIPILVLKL